MTVEFYPAVQGDLNQALDYYEAEGGLHLADRFEGEFRACLAAIEKAPRQFSFYLKSDILRRIRLESFPNVVVYREKAMRANRATEARAATPLLWTWR